MEYSSLFLRILHTLVGCSIWVEGSVLGAELVAVFLGGGKCSWG